MFPKLLCAAVTRADIHGSACSPAPVSRYPGAVVAGFARTPQLAPEWRLFVITGLMGGLSTFSTFSAEVVQRLQDGRLGWAAGEIVIHVSASLAMTILGIATVSLLSR